uniref:Putative salivary kunitz domain protein n=1 Tax=Ixodes ricinus TaxID=34613 RepID=A0A0K8RCA3_IXORI
MAPSLTVIVIGLFLAAITAAQQDFNFGDDSDLRVAEKKPVGRREWISFRCIYYSDEDYDFVNRPDGTLCRLRWFRYGVCKDGRCVPQRPSTTTEEPSPTTQTDPSIKTISIAD